MAYWLLRWRTCPYVNSGMGMLNIVHDRYTTGTRYEMIKMMYCATWVQVTERIPPSTEQKSTPSKPTKTPML
jgi:hypothetical protein